jgi:hypothetical protein
LKLLALVPQLLVPLQLVLVPLLALVPQLLVPLQLVLVPLLALVLKSEQKQHQKLILMPRLIIIYSFTSPIYVEFHYMVKLNLQRTTHYN